MMKAFLTFFIIAFIGCVLHTKTISPLNLLLPLSSEVKVEFPVQAFNGCYKFSSSDPSIISIRVDEEKNSGSSCHTHAIAKVEADSPIRSIIWLIAEEEQTGTILRCESRVAELNRIEITTKLRTIDVGVFETIGINGFDANGNIFSTLEGLKFNWNINQHDTFVEMSSFKESSLQQSKIRQKIESSKEFSDQIVLKTKKIGKVVLEAIFRDQKFASVTNTVTLHITEHVIFRPDNQINMLKCSFLQLSAFILKGNKNDRIIERIYDMKRFKMRVQDKNLGSVDLNGKITADKNSGESFLEIIDSANLENIVKIKLNVVENANLEMKFYESTEENWKEFVEQQFTPGFNSPKRLQNLKEVKNSIFTVDVVYIVKLFAYSKNSGEVILENEKVNWRFVESKFSVLHKNSEFLVLKPIETGSFSIESIIVKENCPQSSIKTSKFVSIQLPVLVLLARNDKNEVFLPSLSLTSATQLLHLTIIGGSNSYNCIISDNSVVKIDDKLNLEVTGNGKSLVRCEDKSNSGNFDEFIIVVEEFNNIVPDAKTEGRPKIAVTVSWRFLSKSNQFYANCTNIHPSFTIDSLKHKSKNTEVQIKSIGQIYSQYKQTLLSFIKERSLSNLFTDVLKWTQKERYARYTNISNDYDSIIENFLELSKGLGICGFVEINSVHPDLYNLNLEAKGYKSGDSFVKIHSNLNVTIIADYNQDIFSNVPLIAYDTSIKFLLTGGPESWHSSKHPIIKVSTTENGKLVNFKSFYTSEGTIIEFKCKPFSDLKNESAKMSQTPQDIHVHILMHNEVDEFVQKPVSMSTDLLFQCATPSDLKHFQVPKINLEKFDFLNKLKNSLNLRNDKHHTFVAWAFDDKNKPFWNFTSVSSSSFLRDSNIIAHFQQIPLNEVSQDYQFLNQHGAKLIELRLPKQTGKMNTIVNLKLPGQDEKILTSAIQVESTEQLDLEPNSSEILLSDKNEVTFTILNGSGHFRVSIDDQKISIFLHTPDSRKIKIRPLKTGKTKLRVIDIGVEHLSEAIADIEIVDMGKLSIQLKDKVIEQKKETEVFFIGSSSLINQVKDLPIKFIASPSRGIEITKQNDGSYIVKGNETGEYFIHAEIDEKPLPNKTVLKVYSELKVFPEKLILMPGCTGFFKIIGGPTNLFTQEYELKISNSDQLGVLTYQQNGAYLFEAGKSMTSNNIEFQFFIDSKKLVSVKLDIIISNPTKIVVSGPFMLFKGASAVINAIPRLNFDDFSPSFCNIDFQYKSLSSKNVLDMIPLTVSQTIKSTFFSLFITGKEIGSENLQFILNFHSSKGDIHLQENYTIKVFENHDLKSVRFLDQEKKDCLSIFGDKSFSFPPNSQFQFPSSLHAILTPLDNVISLSGRNLLITENKIGKDVITLIEIESDAHSGVLVEVLLPSYLVVENIRKLSFLQGKTTFKTMVQYMDNFGRILSKTTSPLNLIVSSSDNELVDFSYDNLTAELSIHAKLDGQAQLVLKSEEFPKLTCFIWINVGTIIKPSGPLIVHIGSEITFESSFEKEKIKKTSSIQTNNQQNEWKATDNNSLEVNSKTGKAIAKNIGHSTVVLRGMVSSEVAVIVTEIVSLQLQNKDFVMTNVRTSSHFKEKYLLEYKVVLRNKDEILSIDSNIKDNLDFSCSSNLPSVKAKPFIQTTNTNQENKKTTKSFWCSLEIDDSSQISEELRILSEIKSNFLSFRVWSSDKIEVMSTFIIKESDKTIRLNKQDKEFTFYVTSPNALSLIPSKGLEKFVESDYNPKKHVQKITLSFPNDFEEDFNGQIEVKNLETQQKDIILIEYEKTVSILNFFSFLQFSSGFPNFNEIVVIIICLAVLWFLVNNILNKKNENDDTGTSMIRFDKLKND